MRPAIPSRPAAAASPAAYGKERWTHTPHPPAPPSPYFPNAWTAPGQERVQLQPVDTALPLRVYASAMKEPLDRHGSPLTARRGAAPRTTCRVARPTSVVSWSNGGTLHLTMKPLIRGGNPGVPRSPGGAPALGLRTWKISQVSCAFVGCVFRRGGDPVRHAHSLHFRWCRCGLLRPSQHAASDHDPAQLCRHGLRSCSPHALPWLLGKWGWGVTANVAPETRCSFLPPDFARAHQPQIAARKRPRCHQGDAETPRHRHSARWSGSRREGRGVARRRSLAVLGAAVAPHGRVRQRRGAASADAEGPSGRHARSVRAGVPQPRTDRLFI